MPKPKYLSHIICCLLCCIVHPTIARTAVTFEQGVVTIKTNRYQVRWQNGSMIEARNLLAGGRDLTVPNVPMKPKYLRRYNKADGQALGFEACEDWPYDDKKEIKPCDWHFNTFGAESGVGAYGPHPARRSEGTRPTTGEGRTRARLPGPRRKAVNNGFRSFLRVT